MPSSFACSGICLSTRGVRTKPGQTTLAAVCRHLASWPKVGRVVGLGPIPVFLAKAQELGKAMAIVSRRAMPAPCLLMMRHSTWWSSACLTHVPGPERHWPRLSASCGAVASPAILEGDYATTTVAIGDHDPLQACTELVVAALVHDRWLQRHVSSAGFRVEFLRLPMVTCRPPRLITCSRWWIGGRRACQRRAHRIPHWPKP